MKEDWRDIPGYEGYYQASMLGRIRSVDRIVSRGQSGYRVKGRIVAQFCRLHGKSAIPYYCTNLSKQGRNESVRVHRLVALTWLGSIPPGCEVRYGSAGSLVNALSNLCYGSRTDNEGDKVRDGTGWHRRVKRNDGMEFASIRIAAKETGCHEGHISQVCRGDGKTAGGYGWSYV